MNTLILEDFRCFADRHEVPIRPLTLLVGENSTGKTSFLAAVRVASGLMIQTTPGFNDEPFQLGSYDQIANNRYEEQRPPSFSIGQYFTFDESRLRQAEERLPLILTKHLHSDLEAGAEFWIESKFNSIDDQPTASSFFVASGAHRIVLAKNPQGHFDVSFLIENQLISREEGGEQLWGLEVNSPIGNILSSRYAASSLEENNKSDAIRFGLLISWALVDLAIPPYAFAPIRSSPRRTYDPIKVARDPEGGHIPMMLVREYGEGESELKDHIDEFGRLSGLYSNLLIRKFGESGSDPFQIAVERDSEDVARNLIDVGYGVSQAIPIIADAASTEPGTTLLIQQPEVHLHPRAQAAMGSFFAQLAASGRNRLVVETHSDYLVDRVRMDVREGKIKASDVVILYFEQGSHGVDIHPIEIDARGHPLEVPPGYRSFFLEEDRRFFGVDP